MKVPPKSIIERQELNLRQGIKSSLSNIRSVVALIYILYRCNNKKAIVKYSESTNGQIKLHSSLESSIKSFLDINDLSIINNNPLFKSQMEALQVGIELLLKLGKVEFVNNTLASSAERTGGMRYEKMIKFGTNIQIIDTFLSCHESKLRTFLNSWINNKDSEEKYIDYGISKLLTIFSEETQFKIRCNDQEISFQQEGIYKELVSGNTVISKDEHENVGPFRVFKSFVKDGLHPYIVDNSDEFAARTSSSDALEYYQMVSNALDLIPKRTQITVIIEQDSTESESLIDNKSLQKQIIFYGAPGTGKSNKIEECTNDSNRIRTTFHPDSDYSTFVGAYKPTMEETGVTVAGKKETRIAYKYVPQAFLKAYVNAWNKIDAGDASPYYLVIEEINRGNCAQIFGDLFQLLDRGDNGESKYAISPDDDVRRFLSEQFKATSNIPETIKNGEEMRLPSNLYIWATMNTSDQSLFPIDSAFKRRWDWEYMPIEKGNKDFVIEIGDKTYDWWNFISIINGKIDEITGSEDKKLGYWFAKPAGDSTTIKCEQFVSKVLFYLWNDVYKDYSDDNRSIFRITDGNNSQKVTFTEFFGTGREEKIHSFMQMNGINPIFHNPDNIQDENRADDEAGIPPSKRDYSKYSINGSGAYGKGELVRRVIDLYCEQLSSSNATDIRAFWMGLNTGIVHLVETEAEFNDRTSSSADSNKRAKELKLSNGESIYISTQVGSGNIQTFISAVNAANIGFTIAKI